MELLLDKENYLETNSHFHFHPHFHPTNSSIHRASTSVVAHLNKSTLKAMVTETNRYHLGSKRASVNR